MIDFNKYDYSGKDDLWIFYVILAVGFSVMGLYIWIKLKFLPKEDRPEWLNQEEKQCLDWSEPYLSDLPDYKKELRESELKWLPIRQFGPRGGFLLSGSSFFKRKTKVGTAKIFDVEVESGTNVKGGLGLFKGWVINFADLLPRSNRTLFLTNYKRSGFRWAAMFFYVALAMNGFVFLLALVTNSPRDFESLYYIGLPGLGVFLIIYLISLSVIQSNKNLVKKYGLQYSRVFESLYFKGNQRSVDTLPFIKIVNHVLEVYSDKENNIDFVWGPKGLILYVGDKSNFYDDIGKEEVKKKLEKRLELVDKIADSLVAVEERFIKVSRPGLV